MATDLVHRGRDAFQRRAWKDARRDLSAADHDGALGPDDLERLALASYLTGHDGESIDLLGRAHQAFVDAGEAVRAARSAFWVGFQLMDTGDRAQAGGWLSRAHRLLDEGQLDCVERGFLLLPHAFQQVQSGDFTAAHASFDKAADIAKRFRDRDLLILARHGQGRSLVQLGRIPEGLALLDEAMVGVTAGEASPVVAGVVYCSVLSVCAQLFDVRRAREWTAALTQWCAAQPDLVPFRGECLVRRAEVLRLQGAWHDAQEEAHRAQAALPQTPGQPIVGTAFYQLAELHRLRGDFVRAEEAYRQASQWLRTPMPGIAQLLLAQGEVDAARAGMQRILDEAREPRVRALSLGPCVDIMLAAGDRVAARAAAQELSGIAQRLGAAFLHATATRALGQVLLAESDAKGALAALRSAWQAWVDIDAPYEVARTRVLIALACRQLGDHYAADLELGAAREALQRLGAAPDVTYIDGLTRREATAAPGGLSAREIEVLRLIAAGKSNRAIADALQISEKTVARHVSNIFTKLGLASRSAATAYAFQHGVV